MKKIVSIFLIVTVFLNLGISVTADNAPIADTANVIFEEDFAQGQLHPADKGQYVANTGIVNNGSYTFDTANQRLLYNPGIEISGGVLCYETKVTFTEKGSATLLMVSDTNGSNNAFSITSDASNIKYNAYDASGSTIAGSIAAYDANKEYTINAYVDLDTGLLQIELDNKVMCGGTKLYINPNNRSGNINRIFDIKTSSAKFTLSSVAVKRIAKLPYDKTEETLWYEDFESFNSSDYTSDSTEGTALTNSVATISGDTTEHGKSLHAQEGVRLDKQFNNLSGVYSVKTDLYIDSAISIDVFQIADANKAQMARLTISDGSLCVVAGETAAATSTSWKTVGELEAKKWYAVDVRIDTATREICVYLNGVKMREGVYLVDKGAAVAHPFYIDNKYASGKSGLYVDNCGIYKAVDYNTKDIFEDVKVDTGADISSAFSNIVAAPTAGNGYVTFKSGNRALKDLTLDDGAVYALNVDVRIPQYGESKDNLLWNSYVDSYTVGYGVQVNGKNIFVYANDASGNTVKSNIVENYDVTKWYNIQVIANLNNKRIRVFVDGVECAADKEMYLKGNTNSITRPYNFDATGNESAFAYDVKSIKLYKDKLLGALNIQNGVLSGDLTLPATVTVDGKTYQVAWATTNSDVIKADGTVNKDVSTAKFPVIQAFVSDSNGTKATRRYTFYAPPGELDFEDKDNVRDNINDMPFVTNDGKLITWTSSHPEIVTATGAVTRPADTTDVTLTASYGDITKTYNIRVIGMNEDNKVFVLENSLYADGDKIIGKSQIANKKIDYKTRIYNATGDKINAMMIMAVYDANGTIVKADVSKYEVAAKSYGDVKTLSYDVGNSDYNVKGFLWETDSLKPYCEECTTDDKKTDLWVLSDSIYANYAENAYNDEGGIGMYIGSYFDNKVTVHNEAHGGTSSKSYMRTYFNKDILSAAKKYDYMLVCFGLNDGSYDKPERYTSETDYKEFLKIYVNAAKDREINVFFVTPTPFGSYDGNTVKYSDNPLNRRKWMKEVAVSMNVKCIELGETVDKELANLSASEQYSKFIQEKQESEGTMLHISKARATELAGRLTQMVKDADINGLSGYVK